MRTITKSVIKLSEIPEELHQCEEFIGHKIHTYQEFHIDNSKSTPLDSWLLKKYPTLKRKISFLIHIDKQQDNE